LSFLIWEKSTVFFSTFGAFTPDAGDFFVVILAGDVVSCVFCCSEMALDVTGMFWVISDTSSAIIAGLSCSSCSLGPENSSSSSTSSCQSLF
jgi:hypothetical protein